MCSTVFNPAGQSYLGPQAFAFDRSKMLLNQPATFVSPVGPLGGSVDPFLPADLDGPTLPPTGAPETFLIDANGVIRYKQIGPITPEVWRATLEPLITELQK